MTASVAPEAPAGAGAELRRGDTSVRVAIAPGAPITSFTHQGREWCARDGWQDYAPTRGACALPTFVAGAAGARFRDGGTLVADEFSVDVRADGTGNGITVHWVPASYPVTWSRSVSFDERGVLCIRCTAANTQRVPLPFVWGMPLDVPWSADAVIDIPRGARARVAQSHGSELTAPASEFPWPSLRYGGHLADLSRPATLPDACAVLCFVELPRGRMALRSGADVLEVRTDPGLVTHARVWINNGYAGPDAPPRRWWRRHVPVRTLSLGPAIGAPDVLSDAVGAWSAARWIEPGQSLTWDARLNVTPFEE